MSISFPPSDADAEWCRWKWPDLNSNEDQDMKIELHNLPPELAEPPKEARGWIAFQPATGMAWRKVTGKWLPIAEANALIEARKSR